MDRYIVMNSRTRMPPSCWGCYRRVAVVELDDDALRAGETPRMISTRARGVRRIIQTWEKLHVGSTERSAFRRALREARAMAQALNDRDERISASQAIAG